MPKTTIFEAALIATVLSVFYPVLLIFLLVFYAIYFGLPFAWLSLVFAIVGGIGGLVLFKRLFPKVEGAKLSKKGDFEKIATMFGLLFGVGGALFTLGSFYDRTVTHTSCATPSTVNVTSPNCKVIETVSIPQLGGTETLDLLFF